MKKWKAVVALVCVACLVGLMAGTALAGYLCDKCGGDVTPGPWVAYETVDNGTTLTIKYKRLDICSHGHKFILYREETVSK